MNDTPNRRSFEVDDLFRFEFITEARLSPNGGQTVYVVQRCNEAKDADDSNLWLADLETGQSLRLTHGDWADSSPAWSPDGASIAFISNRDGRPELYRLYLQGGEACKIPTVSQGCGGPLLWSPDGTRLIFHARPLDPPDLKKPYRLTRAVYRFDGAGYSDVFCRQIFVLQVASGAVRQLTTGAWNRLAAGWSPDGERILLLSSLNPDSIHTSAHLQIAGLEGDIQTILSPDWGVIHNAAWLKDGRLALIGVPAEKAYGSKNDLFVLDPDGSGLDCRTHSLENVLAGMLDEDLPVPWGISLPPILPADDGAEAILNLQQGGEVGMIQVALRGPEQVRVLAGGPRFCFPFQRTGRRLLFGIASPFDPSQLALLDLDSGAERPLTRLNAGLLAQIEQPRLLNLHFNSSDGAEVEGWVMLPPGAPPFPTVLHIHGGPHAAYGHCFSFDFLTLAGAGFAVLFINHRGSTGYGDAFATATHADWGNLDYQDLLAGVDHAIALGLVDPDRLGCCGLSGGGYLTAWIVGHTRRFKAAAPENMVSNFTSFYGTSDIGPVFAVRELGGKPHEVPQVYARCSPITYAHHCATPTLIFVSEQDYRCPPEQSEQFYTVLKANGCTVEMLRFPNSSHGGSSNGPLAVRRQHNQALLEWMQRYLVSPPGL